MMRRRFLASIVVAAGLLLSGCYAPFDWRQFSWPDGGFTVLLPDKPGRETREVTIGDRKLRMDLFATRVEGATFGIGYADLPEPLDDKQRAALVADARDAFVKNLGGTALEDRLVSLDGFVGREFRTEGTREGRKLVMAGRVYATDRRFYQLVFVAPEDKVAGADVTLFLGSLKLVR
jgi:hypothetical protein